MSYFQIRSTVHFEYMTDGTLLTRSWCLAWLTVVNFVDFVISQTFKLNSVYFAGPISSILESGTSINSFVNRREICSKKSGFLWKSGRWNILSLFWLSALTESHSYWIWRKLVYIACHLSLVILYFSICSPRS